MVNFAYFPQSEDELGALIELLQTAKRYGYEASSSSSPLTPILEVITDLNLRLAQFFDKGGPLQERNNPSIKEMDISDALGNAKMIKLFDRPKWAYQDPKISIFFRGMARSYQKFLKTGKLTSFVQKRVLADFRFRSTLKERSKKAEKTGKEIKDKTPISSKIEVKNASYWFYRRQRKSGKRVKRYNQK